MLVFNAVVFRCLVGCGQAGCRKCEADDDDLGEVHGIVAADVRLGVSRDSKISSK